MAQASLLFTAAALFGSCAVAQTVSDSSFQLALPNHQGQLRWTADGFKIVQSSAKPNGREIGIRGQDESRRLTFLGFLFVFPEQAPLTSAKCRDGVLEPAMRSNPTMTMLANSEIARQNGLPVATATYTTKTRDGSILYSVRSFIATGDICGDLEIYSGKALSAEDGNLKSILDSYRLNEHYAAKFNDILVYAQVLFKSQMYGAAAPMFEEALAKLKDEPSAATRNGTRILIDQAGMAYGISGDVAKARLIFEKAAAEDPEYPLNYYNLACADAQQNKLQDARLNLQKAFARKANIIPGETMPDPTKDDSFLPYRNNSQFWKFLEDLQANR